MINLNVKGKINSNKMNQYLTREEWEEKNLKTDD